MGTCPRGSPPSVTAPLVMMSFSKAASPVSVILPISCTEIVLLLFSGECSEEKFWKVQRNVLIICFKYVNESNILMEQLLLVIFFRHKYLSMENVKTVCPMVSPVRRRGVFATQVRVWLSAPPQCIPRVLWSVTCSARALSQLP